MIVGAGHVFRLEEPIRHLLVGERPDVVALELDRPRYEGLLQRAAGTFDSEAAHKNAPRVYRNLARFQEDLAKQFGTDVGGEMLAAAKAARDIGSKIALIDRNAEQVVRQLLKEMGWLEKARLFGASILARFRFRGGSTVEEEVARYQADPAAYLKKLQKSYPSLKRILLDERNEHMAKQLRLLLRTHPKVVAVVGDGHVDGLVGLLADLKPRAIRLSELRAHRPGEWKVSAAGDKVTFSFDQRSLEGEFRRGP